VIYAVPPNNSLQGAEADKLLGHSGSGSVLEEAFLVRVLTGRLAAAELKR
jgi:hypothetical protein